MTAKPQITAGKLLAAEADPILFRLAQRRSKQTTRTQRQRIARLLRKYAPHERKH